MRTRLGVRLWTIKQSPFLQGGGIPIWDFDPDAATFTPKMRKNLAPGGYTVAPMLQGDALDSDTQADDSVSYSDGGVISGRFYGHGDQYQGSIFFTWRPQVSYDQLASGVYYIFHHNNNLYFYYDYANDRFGARLGSSVLSTWDFDIVAGTDYYICLRWDTNNTLDGTNRRCLSINDVHYFAAAAASTPSIGLIPNLKGQAPGIMSGFAWYRRPLFDGTYGIDAGNGDEISAFSITWQRAIIETGSWDVCFSMPTNDSTGEFATGTTHAWSHPHGSNLLGAGGFMHNGTYTTDGWADEGSPTAVAALAAAEKIFHGGYKVTSDAANEGIYKDYTCTAGDDFVIRAIAHSDGTSIPKLILYDQTNTAEIGSLTGSNASTRTAPDVFLFTGTAPTGCTTIRVKLINTDATASDITYWHQCELLNSVIHNPSFEGTFDDESGGGGGTVNIAPHWKNAGLETDGSDLADKETTTVYSGSSSQRLVVDIAGEGIRNETEIYARNVFYSSGVQVNKHTAGGNIQVYCPGYASNLGYTIDAWRQNFMVGIKTNGTDDFNIRSRHAGFEWFTDDVYGIELDHVSLTVTPASEAASTGTNGIRCDGLDLLTQPISGMKATSGKFRFNWTPEHSNGDFTDFFSGNSHICRLWKDSSNYIYLYHSNVNNIKLGVIVAGAAGEWEEWALPTITAGTTYLIEIEYTPTQVIVSFDGTVRITLTYTGGIDFGANIPDIAYMGSNNSGTEHGDAVFGAPS